MDTITALFDAPLPVRLTIDDIVLIVTALEHHRQIFDDAARAAEENEDTSRAAKMANESDHYATIIAKLDQAALPALTVIGQANDHVNSCVR